MVAWTPKWVAAYATPWAWLPIEAATTPRARSSGARHAILLAAPRILNEPVTCRFSALRYTVQPAIALKLSECSNGVGRTTSWMRSAACRTSSSAMGKRDTVVLLSCSIRPGAPARDHAYPRPFEACDCGWPATAVAWQTTATAVAWQTTATA